MRFAFDDEIIAQLRAAQTRLGWGDEISRREDAFLVTSGMGSALYLTRDGRVLADPDPTFGGPPFGEADDNEAMAAMVLAAEKFAMPVLLTLLPPAPPDATSCSTCEGKRWVDVPAHMICYTCAGRGWHGWRAFLREHVRARRVERPIREPKELTPLALEEHRAQGGFLSSWLRQHGPSMLSERSLLFEERGELAADPLIVMHGDEGCLAAMRILLRGAPLAGEGRVLALLSDEYAAFVARRPEPREFEHHVSSWSYFRPATPELLEDARALGKKIDPALTYRNHVNGTLWGPHCGLEVENLWSWNGRELDLVEEAIRHKRF